MKRQRGWKPYVTVAARRAQAMKKIEKLRKGGLGIKPIEIEGRKIARTFWGKAWCDHLESFSDYENRLPRGRTYVRNGSVCHLEVAEGKVEAMVSGSEIYTVSITIKALPQRKWRDVKSRCAGKIGSLLELLQGKLATNVMSVVTDQKTGLFPLPGEISLQCSCPDWATMCKHVAAVLYGVGARLDEQPELLFLLRGVDQEELISVGAAASAAASAAAGAIAGAATGAQGNRRRIAADALGDVFGIEMSDEKTPEQPPASGAITGKTVTALRAKFGMSRSEFAKLLGASAASIANWENKPGTLHLQRRTLEALVSARTLTRQQARKKLG